MYSKAWYLYLGQNRMPNLSCFQLSTVQGLSSVIHLLSIFYEPPYISRNSKLIFLAIRDTQSLCLRCRKLYCCCCCWVTSVVSDCATPQMAVHQAPPSLGFSRQEYWSEKKNLKKKRILEWADMSFSTESCIKRHLLSHKRFSECLAGIVLKCRKRRVMIKCSWKINKLLSGAS